MQNNIQSTAEERIHIERRTAQARAGAAVEELIGNTPLLAFRRITAHLPEGVEVLAKAEWANPGGSVKDRRR